MNLLKGPRKRKERKEKEDSSSWGVMPQTQPGAGIRWSVLIITMVIIVMLAITNTIHPRCLWLTYICGLSVFTTAARWVLFCSQDMVERNGEESLVQGYPVSKAALHPDSLTTEPEIRTLILILYITWGQIRRF